MNDFANFNFVQSDEEKQEEITAEQNAKQARIAKLVEASNLELAKQLKRQEGVPLLFGATAPRVAANPVGQEEWNARLYSLTAIIRQPERTDVAYPMATTWKELYPHIPYNGKATNWKISGKNKELIKNLLVELGMYKRISMDTVKDVIAVVKDFRKTQIIKEQAAMLKAQDATIRKFELMVDTTSNNFWYKGHEIKRLTRKYSVNVGGIDMSVPLNGIDKLFDIFAHIDSLK